MSRPLTVVKSIDHMVLTCASIPQTVTFYTKYLGMRAETFTPAASTSTSTSTTSPRVALKFGTQKINLHERGKEFEPKARTALPGTADVCFVVDEATDLETVASGGPTTKMGSQQISNQPTHLLGDDFSTAPTPLNQPTAQSSRVLVIGGGVTGLTTAWLLLDRGYRVTIISREWASYGHGPRLASQVAGALWELPPAGCGPQALQDKLPMVQKWALEGLEIYRTIAENPGLAAAFGVKMRMCTIFHLNNLDQDAVKGEKIELIKQTKLQGFSRGTHLFQKYGVNVDSHGGLVDSYEHLAPVIDTDVAMAYLMRLVWSKGARLETDAIHGDVLAQEDHLLQIYGADAIVNATGVWAGEAATDKTVYPLRGGLLRLINDGTDFPKVENCMVVSSATMRDGNFRDMAFLVPRNDSILCLGSILHQDSWHLDLTPTCPEVEEMRARCEDLLPMLKNARLDPQYPLAQGRRPMRQAHVRVECEDRRTNSGRESRIIHSYGHGGAGWTLAFGSARQVVSLVGKRTT
ncbi:Glyoxalase domain-containing protein 5 [Cladobotryum mycophilum]|uniref:Glyoxalase domain-containing protein 5 n=1 Tax=Cladobotryum mycophilum TaxID=491253 RepID=A0ABR0SX52_9HYPO